MSAARRSERARVARQIAVPVAFLACFVALAVIPIILTGVGLSETPTIVLSMTVVLGPLFVLIAFRGGSGREDRGLRLAGPALVFAALFLVGAVAAALTAKDATLWIVLLFVGAFFLSVASASRGYFGRPSRAGGASAKRKARQS